MWRLSVDELGRRGMGAVEESGRRGRLCRDGVGSTLVHQVRRGREGRGKREERRMKANSLTLVYFSSYNEIHLQCMHLRKCEKAAR